MRHAQASEATITVGVVDASIKVNIEDNGRGGRILHGNGLAGMRERLEVVNGELHVSNLQPGVRISAVLAMPHWSW